MTFKDRLTFLHKCSAAFDVVIAVKAILDQLFAKILIEGPRFYDLFYDLLDSGYRQRRISTDRLAIFFNSCFEFVIWNHAGKVLRYRLRMKVVRRCTSAVRMP